MKHVHDTLYQRFADIVREVDGWMNIDQFLALCDEHGVFDEGAQAEMVANYKKAEIRKMLRRMAKYPSADGMDEKIEWVNLIIQTPDGHSQQVYKQLALFDAGDFVQVVRERMSRVKYWQAEVQRLVDMAVVRFGPRIQDMLPFNDVSGAGGDGMNLSKPQMDDTPLVTVGQGDYERHIRPSDLTPPYDPDDPPHLGEGGSLALVVLIFVFILGIVMGAILW